MKARILKTKHADITHGEIGELHKVHNDGAEIVFDKLWQKQDGAVVKSVKESRTVWFQPDEYEVIP